MSKLAHVLSHMTLPQGAQIHTYGCLAYFPSKKELLISFLIFNQLIVCTCACMHVHVCLCLCVCVYIVTANMWQRPEDNLQQTDLLPPL